MLRDPLVGAMPKGNKKQSMALKQKLSATEHGALANDDAKGMYKLVGADYVLDVEGIDNIVNVVSTIAAERTRANTAETGLKRFEGIDPDRYKTLDAAERGAGVTKLKDAGEFDKAIEKVNSDHAAELAKERARNDSLTVKTLLRSGLIAAGVIPERLDDAEALATGLVKLDETGKLRILDTAGALSATDPAKFFKEDFRTQKSYLYSPNGGSGSGSKNGTAGHQDIGDKQTKTRTEFSALSSVEKIAFSNLVSDGKAVIVADA